MAAGLWCQLRHITKSYPVAQGRQAIFSDLTLDISLDGITVLVGKSGCGKTTLLRLLANLETPDQGELVFTRNGIPVQPNIGMVFQESRLFPWMSVAENIMLSREGWAADAVLPLMDLVGLDRQYQNSRPAELSGGMAHRVAIARALAYEPDLLLMDEPFAALDYFTRMTLQQKVIEIQRQMHTAVVFVTHNVEEALLLAKRILVLKKGEIPVSFLVDAAYPRRLEDAMLVQHKKNILDLLL